MVSSSQLISRIKVDNIEIASSGGVFFFLLNNIEVFKHPQN